MKLSKDIYELIPDLKEYLWAGNKLKKYKKTQLENISESWELSFLDIGQTKICENNVLYSLKDVLDKEFLGERINNFKEFPFLIKFIDSNDSLSIQVHPNDEYAFKNEKSLGKVEMWYILESEEDSFIYLGLNKDLKKEEIEEYSKDDRILNYLNKVYCKKGDLFLIEPGTIHAIGKGITLIEIQESSNITYRLYDFNRVDKNNKKRELHIDKCLDVLNLNKYNVKNLNYLNEYKTKYFEVYFNKIPQNIKDSCKVVTILEGNGYLNNIEVKPFTSYIVKANKEIKLSPNLKFIITLIP